MLPKYKDQASKALSDLASVSLKDYLEVIAMEQGARCWDDLCLSLEPNARLYIKGMCDSGMNVWFREYSEAKVYLRNILGVIYCLTRIIFICHKGHIERSVWIQMMLIGKKLVLIGSAQLIRMLRKSL